MRVLYSSILAVSVWSCASTTGVGQTPSQVVFATRAGYEAALVIAVEYKRLPPCTVPASTPICSDPGIVAQLQQADNVTNIAMSSAVAAVRTPQIGSNAIDKAVATANAALAALTAITSQLRTR